MAYVDEVRARQILTRAVDAAKNPSYTPHSPFAALLEGIVLGSHLTYRYIAVTGLLGKATNSAINALALQAGAPIDGAYDARSLCHGVVVPLERTLLANCLGGSNEPFLNKPARFTHLATTNAVRRGQDERTLRSLISVLSRVSADQAFDALCDSLHFALKRNAGMAALKPKSEPACHSQILDFGRRLMQKSVEGQTAAVYFGTLLTCLFSAQSAAKVLVHPVNQSGASSREICDVDVKLDDRTIIGYEIKDKAFTEHDVEHAARKAGNAGLYSLGVVMGPQAFLSATGHVNAAALAKGVGVSVVFIDLLAAAAMILTLLPTITANDFLKELTSVCAKARVKDEVYAQIKTAASASGLSE